MEAASPVSLGDSSTRAEENRKVEQRILDRAQDLHENYPDKIKGIKDKAEKTIKSVQQKTSVLFGLGVGLVIISVILLILSAFGFIASSAVTGLEMFGIGSLGAVDLFGLLFYKPIEESKKALQDFVQAMLLTEGWLLSINVILRGMDLSNADLTVKAGALIQSMTTDTVAALEKYI